MVWFLLVDLAVVPRADELRAGIDGASENLIHRKPCRDECRCEDIVCIEVDADAKLLASNPSLPRGRMQ